MGAPSTTAAAAAAAVASDTPTAGVDPEVGSSGPAHRARSIIGAEGVTVRYGRVLALDAFSATVPRGIVGLLGPNGAGKTTLIKTTLGLIEPDEGRITVAGYDPRADLQTVRDMIGYLPEDDCVIPRMNAVQFVAYLAELSGLTPQDAQQRTHEVLDFVGIEDERYRQLESYSTGMKQRVKLAQAIVHDPPLLFLDEPTNGMDPPGREEMLDLIRKIGRSGKTILVSSHILHEIEQVCEHVIIINAGRLLRAGPLAALIHGSDTEAKLVVRGAAAALEQFERAVRSRFEVLASAPEPGRNTFRLMRPPSSQGLFELAVEAGVQIRSYGTERLSLEAVFLDTLETGGVSTERGVGHDQTTGGDDGA